MRRAVSRAVTGVLIAGGIVALGIGHTHTVPPASGCHGPAASNARFIRLIGETTSAVELAARRGPCGSARTPDDEDGAGSAGGTGGAAGAGGVPVRPVAH